MSNSPDQWLIRTAENRILGPYTRNEVCQFIEQGRLQLNDEVCNANQYWFYLHEHEEIRHQLGIELPKELYPAAEESTQTETDTDINETTDPEIDLTATRVASMSTMSSASAVRGAIRPAPSQSKDSQPLPELVEPPGDAGDNTAMLSNRAYRDYRKSNGTNHPSPIQPAAPVVRGIGVEKSRLMQFLILLMTIGAVGLLFLVIRLLQNQPSG